jgi:hypothetical protein
MRPLQPLSKLNKALLSAVQRFNASSRGNITEGRQCIKDVYISLNKIELYLEKYNIPLNSHLDKYISDNNTDMNGKKIINHMNYKSSSEGDPHTYSNQSSTAHSHSLENMVTNIYVYVYICIYVYMYMYHSHDIMQYRTCMNIHICTYVHVLCMYVTSL